MSPATYIPIIFLWIIIFILFRNQRKAVILRKIIEKKKSGGNTEMKDLAQRFIDKECLIYSFDGSHQYEGVIKEVTLFVTMRSNSPAKHLAIISLNSSRFFREVPEIPSSANMC